MSTRAYGESREAILAAAAGLIRERGVGATSVADIIAASGTSAGAMYHHFPGKADLVLAVAEQAVARPVAMALADQGSIAPAELFRLAADRVVADAEIGRLLLQIWAGATADARMREVLQHAGVALLPGIAAHINDWCTERGRSGLAVASTIAGLVMGLVVQQGLFAGFDLEGYVGEAQHLLEGA